MAKKPKLQERLKKIVNISFEILSNKIVGGQIEIANESSLQMQFGVILQQIGKLYEYSNSENFFVELETPQELDEISNKSNTTNARCDIMLTLKSSNVIAKSAIEIKYFKKNPNEAVTDNRYSVMLDLANLESYKGKIVNGHEIVYTDNKNYADSNSSSKFKLVGQIPKEISEYAKRKSFNLKGDYNAKWLCFDKENHYFLKLDIQK